MKMKKFWTQPLMKHLAITALAAMVIHGAIILVQWYAVSPIGFGGEIFLQFIVLSILPFLVVVLAVPASLFLLPFRKTRRYAVTVVLCGPVYVLIGLTLFQASQAVRMHGFQRLAARSQPLVGAIHRFVDEAGRPPVNLQELVPQYLPEIPSTGMPAYPKYLYSTAAYQWGGNPWVLHVECTFVMNFDKFMYFPMQNYPEIGYGGPIERVGDWAYVHE